jgi:hypothetical protein
LARPLGCTTGAPRPFILSGIAGTERCGAELVSGPAAEKDLTDKGEVLVKHNCSRCHAIGKEGNSPHPEAPPFRTLSSRYPIEDLFRVASGGNRLRPFRCRSSCSAPRTSRQASNISIRFRKSLRETKRAITPLLIDGAFGPHQPIARGLHLPGREMLDVAAHEGRNQARPEMVHVGIGHYGNPAEIPNMP